MSVGTQTRTMLGIDGNGTKHPLSLIEGATENGRLTAEIGAIEVRPLASRTGGMVALFNAGARRTF